jgi:NitT/TauT family transport system permease protein
MSRQGAELTVDMPEPASFTTTEPALIDRISCPAAPPRAWRELAAILAVPAACVFALAVHFLWPDRGPRTSTHSYPTLLFALLTAGTLTAVTRPFWPGLRRWHTAKAPLLAAGIVTVCAWEVITIKLALLPLMYFPRPETIVQTLIDDRVQLFDSTWHSLTLLLKGYAVGVLSGLITGITIGWSSNFRYWGMPVLKIVGPIPATAWIPMALVIFPQSTAAGVFLIALTVWFPVTMLSASGVSNVPSSFIDVARTLGAGERYLIFRVAIPAAMPSIFIGLFMGLGASFLTLLVAESTGVSSGLGWYIDWARNYSDYNKVFAALIIMAAFFSTIMTLLFKVRDRVLVWQKGVIKW